MGNIAQRGYDPSWRGRLVRARSDLRSRTMPLTRSAASSGSSCSHTRTANQPADAKRSSVSRSRRRLPSIFFRQNSALFLGHVACVGHPCQKQPSTKTATLDGPNSKSASRRTPRRGLRWTRYRSPAACSARRKASSTSVSRLFCLLMRVRVCGVVCTVSRVFRRTISASQPRARVQPASSTRPERGTTVVWSLKRAERDQSSASVHAL